MWSCGEDNSTNRCTSSFSSKSSSTSSSNFSPSSSLTAPSKKRTMEEVWKDIGLRSLQNPPPREEAESKSSYRRTILQEFLARPFGDQQHLKTALLDPSPDMGIHAFASTPHPATALSLNSGPEFQYLDSPGLKNSNPFKNLYGGNFNASFGTTSLASPFDVLQSSLPKRRMTESAEKCADRRLKRMIKNRDSAARSRARKQAYTGELEQEVANLMEENVRLKKQQQQQQGRLAGSGHLSQRRSLCRTSTI
ncbi:protein FD-like [Aristolochia californica]|uniref:protein FD-like n=1 Tax=Aristolochia californica TaxID=171875 RepID=UPI0035D54BC8